MAEGTVLGSNLNFWVVQSRKWIKGKEPAAVLD